MKEALRLVATLLFLAWCYAMIAVALVPNATPTEEPELFACQSLPRLPC